MDKPLYAKFINSADFNNKEDAEFWAKSQKAVYKGVDSIKYDIERTPNSGWKVKLYVKL